jgi:hypothetical protein
MFLLVMLDVYVYVGCGPNTLIVLIGVRTTARLLLYPFLHDTAREGSLLRGLTSRLCGHVRDPYPVCSIV